MKKTICLLLAILFAVTAIPVVSTASAPVSGTCGKNVVWSLEDGKLTVSGDGAMRNYPSPSDTPWFEYSDSISSVVISDGITDIGKNAFAYCRISEVSLPPSVTSVRNGAFSFCYKLKSFKAAGLTDLGERVFDSCYNLSSVSLPNALQSIGDYCFVGCTSLKRLTFPRELEKIGSYAFLNCITLSSVVLYASVTEIGKGAFMSCYNLKDAHIPDGVTEIADYVFLDCRSLTDAFLGRNVARVGKDAFLWCESLNRITLPSTVSYIEDYAVGYYYFDGKYVKYDDFTLIASPGYCERYASRMGIKIALNILSHECDSLCLFCGGCKNKSCIYVNCAVKCSGHKFPMTGECGENARWSLDKNGNMTISGSGDTYDYKSKAAPWYPARRSIKTLTVSDGITKLGEYSFADCPALTAATMSESVLSVGAKAFYECFTLSSVKADKTVSVGRLAFARCGMESISLPSCRDIGNYAFIGCSSLSDASVPSLVSAGDGAFEDCAMNKISLTESATSIGDRPFGFAMGTDRILRPIQGFSICGPFTAYEARKYAEANDFTFVRTDDHKCESKCTLCGGCRSSECVYPECAVKCVMRCDEWVNPFADVKAGEWYYDNVRYVSLAGLFDGTAPDTFEPNIKLSRAMFVTVLYRASGSPSADGTSSFADVKAGAWYADAVAWAEKNGVVNGVTPERFAPDDGVTREQMAAIMYRVSESQVSSQSDQDGNASALSQFKDAGEISSYASDAMEWAVRIGLINGKSEDTLEPRSGATRAEAATIMRRRALLLEK